MRPLLLCVVSTALLAFRTQSQAGEVVVYTSVDDVFARPICQQFEKQTGIKVKLVPDTEETKSTGLLNRLIAEKRRPQADVFWSGDPIRAEILKNKGISAAYQSPSAEGLPKEYSDPEGHWTGFSARAKIILYNTKLCPPGKEPTSIFDFMNPSWNGKGCMANPLFGTTSMFAAALFDALGEDMAQTWFGAASANGMKMLSSNGEVKRAVAAGDYAFGLTDTDDAAEAIKDGKPVGVVYPDSQATGTLLIPNAAVLIANGPNGENGRKFIDYLLTPEVEQALAEGEAAQIPLRSGVAVPDGMKTLPDLKQMKVDYAKVAKKLEELSRGFLKDWTAKQR
ncbi:MAG: extracellular solute-binding protein [Chthoniobacterales bacterium]|nr:extracellular solute-binding protein [Chthoniobacterales bacterium]